jgi:hypothetical protein
MLAGNLDTKAFINTESNGTENVDPTSSLRLNSFLSHFGVSIYVMKNFPFMGQE